MTEHYLVFKASRTKLFKKLLKKDFGHVFVLSKDKYNWLMLDPALDGFYVRILGVSAQDDFAIVMSEQAGVTVLKLKKSHVKKRYNFVWFVMCSGFVQYYLNLRFFALTPYKLYKKLIKNNLVEEV